MSRPREGGGVSGKNVCCFDYYMFQDAGNTFHVPKWELVCLEMVPEVFTL